MPLHEGVPYAVSAQEQGCGQAHQKATDDQDRNPVAGFFTHRCLPKQRSGYGAPRSFHALRKRGPCAQSPTWFIRVAHSLRPAHDRGTLTSRHPRLDVELCPEKEKCSG
ncbi:hypothetical protein GCM10022206_18790 [Streptomyces chiangmaiensis]